MDMRDFLFQVNDTNPNKWKSVRFQEPRTHREVAKYVAVYHGAVGVTIHVAHDHPNNLHPNGAPLCAHAIVCALTTPVKA